MFGKKKEQPTMDDYRMREIISDALKTAIENEERVHGEWDRRKGEPEEKIIHLREMWTAEREKIDAIEREYPEVYKTLKRTRNCPYCKKYGNKQ